LQIHINKLIFILLFFTHTLFGCALCTIYSPKTLVSIEVNATENKINDAKILWVLTKDFTEQLKELYDKNQNNYLDKDELVPIEQSLIDYIKPKKFLTYISYAKEINNNKSEPIKVKTYKTFIKNSLLHFEYIIELNYDVINNNVLYFNINDDQNYFVLVLANNAIKFNAPFNISNKINMQDVSFYIKNESLNQEIKETKTKTEKTIDTLTQVQTNEKIKNQEDSLLNKFTKEIKKYLLKIKDGDSLALFSLLLISFIYGIIHALGPGHGKSLAFSYFMANKSSYLKAFFISQATAFIHILGALILVLISVFILESVLNSFVSDSVEVLTKVSAILIILLAVYIFSNKITHKECSCSSCKTNERIWSAHKPKNTTNLKPNFMKKDLYFVLTAGLIPCPGTVILFIYAFILKTYFAVILASIFISLGMGLVIFISSFFAVSLNKVSQSSQKLINFFEFLAPIVMFLLGVLLYFNSQYI
jgi:ABC-type nickel/cobalt efflux system permease component RcnA